ncbi:MAG: gliding motility-associated C-terminal domain-containing protein [Saprospiraceae bacterium]|nr:gliding motility-associated C-terminal domain-containing protein [Saprospiraceae bacterium]
MKNKNFSSCVWIILSILFCTEFIRAQQDFYCGHETFLYELLQDATFSDLTENLQKKYVIEHQSATAARNSGDEIVIPLIIHIIHNNGIENISDQQVIKGLQYLNNAFANEGHYTKPENTDTGIRFCLAKRNSRGEPISGIIRYNSIYTDMRLSGARRAIYDMTDFESEKAMHIFLVKKSCLGSNCKIAGFSGLVSGIFMDAQYFGSIPNHSKVAPHEMGHYLGLYHTFYKGCPNDDCLNDGDKVCDTPPDNQTGKYPCSVVFNSCRSDDNDHRVINPFRPVFLGGTGDQPDLGNNFMDYIFEGCADGFTAGQSARMHFYLNTLYKSLLTSKSCFNPCLNPPEASYSISTDSILSGDILTVSDQSENALYYRWYLDGVFISDQPSPAIPFTIPGRYTLRLEVSGNDPACDISVTEKTITVLCGVRACFESEIRYPYLIFRDCSVGRETISWTVRKNGKDIIYSGTNTLDSIYINNIYSVQICLHSNGIWCNDTHCIYVDIQSDGSEICDNGIDDDGDGLIDLFDPNCHCNNTAYQAQCPSDCPVLPDSFPDFKMKLKWVSELVGIGLLPGNPLVGDINNDGNVDVIFVKNERGANGFLPINRYLVHVDGKTGNVINEKYVGDRLSGIRIGGIADLNNNGYSEIITLERSYLSIFDKDFNLLMKTEISSQSSGESAFTADIDGDGIAEICKSDVVYNSQTGKIVMDFKDEKNCIFGSVNAICNFPQNLLVDVLPSPGLEIVSGKVVFEISLTDKNGQTGNFINPVYAPSPVLDGFFNVADIDMDGKIDVVVARGKSMDDSGGIWIWDPRTQNLIASGEVGELGGFPTIGDVDGDCIPEIGVIFKNELWMYKYDGSDNLKLMYVLPIIERSGRTSITMFDFNQDGKMEIVYKDEENLMIIDGPTGTIISTTPLRHGTGLEYPVIADVDGDGQAEILITGYTTTSDEYRLFCYGTDGTPWAPARSVWNQYNYNPTYINDDLTIPRYPQHTAQSLQGTENCPQVTCATPYNNFMVQATYRTQEGCYVWPEHNRDLTISATSRCLGDSIEICFSPRSSIAGDSALMVYISCFLFISDDFTMIDKIAIRSDTCIWMQKLSGVDSMFIVINETGGIFPPSFTNTTIAECDYTNNVFVLDLKGPDLTIDILSYECTGDSLIFYISTDNKGAESDIPCISGGCYFTDPTDNDQNPPLEITEWCFKYDNILMQYQYRDTFRVAIPLPAGQTGMWWTINEGGFGPGLASSLLTDIYECNYTNNTAYISFDLTEKTLDLGPDITKCGSDVVTLDAGAEFNSYLWSDLTTEAVYSSSDEGIHYVEATDQCGRMYRDTVTITIDRSNDIDLGADVTLCVGESYAIQVSDIYDRIQWFPSEMVDCDTCPSVQVITATSGMLIAVAQIENCISIDTMEIQVLTPPTEERNVRICDGESFDFYGDILTASGSYVHAKANCDSIITLRLEVYTPDSTEISERICRGDSVLFDGRYVNTPGDFTSILQNKDGCDSLVTLRLSVSDTLVEYSAVNLCEGDSVLIAGSWVKNSGSYTEMFTSISTGCDSMTITEVNVQPEIVTVLDYQLCEGDSVLIAGSWVKNSGSYTEMFTSVSTGCDSMTITEVNVLPEIVTVIDFQMCDGDSVFVYDRWLHTSGEYTIESQTNAGCDSIIIVDLSISPTYQSEETYSICTGDSIYVHDQWVKASGNYPGNFISLAGCDSMSVVVVEVLEAITTETDVSLCSGDSIYLSGGWVSEAGLYEERYTATGGCDSLVRTVLSISPTTEQRDSIGLCDGETITLHGESISAPGDYIHMIPGAMCDIRVYSHIYSLPISVAESNFILCPNDSIQINGEWIFQSGDYRYTFSNLWGCDSFFTAKVQLLSDPPQPELEADCDEGHTIARVTDYNFWQPRWSTGSDASEVIFRTSGPASLVWRADPDCEVTYNWINPDVSGLSEVPTLGDVNSTDGSSIPMTTGLDESEWTVIWSPAWAVSCSPCSETNIKTGIDTEITVTMTHISGCVYVRTLRVSVESTEVVLPNIFAPSSTGPNRLWSIQLPLGYELKEIFIYDRWGNQVAGDNIRESLSWDGRFKGMDLQPGVFVYFMKYADSKGNMIVKRGDVTLMR